MKLSIKFTRLHIILIILGIICLTLTILLIYIFKKKKKHSGPSGQRQNPPPGFCSNGKQISPCIRTGIAIKPKYITVVPGDGEASTTMYTPIESTNPNLGFGCSKSCSLKRKSGTQIERYTSISSPTQCSADSPFATKPHIGYGPNCTCIRDIAEQLARIPTPAGVIGWVILASASPMRANVIVNSQTAKALGGSCWELTPAKIANYPNVWSTDNSNIPFSPTLQKLYGVVLGKCPCSCNSTFCCCTNGKNGGVKTYNHFDIWLPGCTPNMPANNPGKQCFAKYYCGMTSTCGGPNNQNTYCPENQYPCWSSIQRKWGTYTVAGQKKWDTMQNWNVKFQQIECISPVTNLINSYDCQIA